MQSRSSEIYDLLAYHENVEYSLKPHRPELTEVKSNTACVVTAVLVKNRNVKENALLHVLLPKTHVLGLDLLNKLFDANYEAYKEERLQTLLDGEQLTSLPSIPRWAKLPTLVDSSVFMYDKVFLDPGNGVELVELEKSSFSKLVARCLRANIASTIESLKSDAAKDEEAISSSLSQFTERRIKQRLDETLELPPMPRTSQKIVSLRADPEADISDLAQLVEIDPSLSAQVVSWASSPYYAAPGEIKSVHDAIVRVLGFDMVLNMALGLTLGKSMSMESLSASEIQDYWREAVLVASTMESLVGALPKEGRPERGLAYLAGLLSNFGTVVMAEVFPLYHKQVKRIHSANRHCDLLDIELYALGTCGQQMASWLLQQWSMPRAIHESIRQSALDPRKNDISHYAKLMQLSKALLSDYGLLPAPRLNHSEFLMQELNINADRCAEVLEKIKELEDEFMCFSRTLAR